MNKNKYDFLAISIGPHLAFKKFMESVGAQFHQIPKHISYQNFVIKKGSRFVRSLMSIPSGYKYYVSESCFYYSVAARKLGRIDGKIIDLCASPIYYYIFTNRIKGIGRRILLNFLEDVDGFLFEGNFVGDVIRKLGIEKPSSVVYTYVRPDRFNILLNMKPNLKSKNITIIPTNDYFYKGLDILLEAMKIVNQVDSEITLTIAPKNINFIPVKHLMTSNVIINSDVCSVLRNTSLYVHPSRGDVFPVAPLEAMLSGIPTIVSEDTGTKEIIENIEEDFVTKLDYYDVAEKILYYFSLSSKNRYKLSNSFRTAAKNFNEKCQISNFKRAFASVINSV